MAKKVKVILRGPKSGLFANSSIIFMTSSYYTGVVNIIITLFIIIINNKIIKNDEKYN